MTATQPAQAPNPGREPTPEEIDAFNATRFASIDEMLETWFALCGHQVRFGPPGFMDRDAATG